MPKAQVNMESGVKQVIRAALPHVRKNSIINALEKEF
jgi:hypothetical protein